MVLTFLPFKEDLQRDKFMIRLFKEILQVKSEGFKDSFSLALNSHTHVTPCVIIACTPSYCPTNDKNVISI